jgi:aminoglycoside phosphotransferase (APT) family kinase protein
MRLTPRLLARLALKGFVVERAVRLSRAGDSPSFRAELDDGRVVKIRLFATSTSARKMWDLIATAGDAILARPLLRLGPAIVSEYVNGEPLDQYLAWTTPKTEVVAVRAAGRQLARLHRKRTPSKIARSPESYRRLLAREAQLLARKGLLDRAAVEWLATLRTPRAGRCALTHGDVCPENLVLSAAGDVRLIDEERLAIRPVAFDLARVVTRWPLGPRCETELLRAYRNAGGDDRGFNKDRVFWIALALTASAAYRTRRRLPGVDRAVMELRALTSGPA